MAELTQEERLQPSLLDRLTDDEPSNLQESRERRVLSMRKLREVVLRDLVWLLNTTNLSCTGELEDYPDAAASVLNYGVPDLTGATVSGLQIEAIERALRQAIWHFEPRILRDTVRVRVNRTDDQMNRNAVSFEIEGELWAQPIPLRLFLKTEIDLETGEFKVTESVGQGAR